MAEVWFGCVRIPDMPTRAMNQAHKAEDPFVVVDDGRVAGISHTPRRAGVETGMTDLRARSFCEEATFHPRDYGIERTIWEEMLRSLNEHTPRIEPERPGLAWIEPRDGDSLRAWLDEKQCHCGVAPNRPVALLAARKATSGRVICIEECYEESFLSRTPTDVLSNVGFSEEITERLSLFGYEDIESLNDLTKRHLTAQFGEEGERLYNFLHPEAERVSFYSPPPAVSVTQDVGGDVREPGPLREALKEMSETLYARLSGKTCQRLSVTLSGRKEDLEASRFLREPIAKPGPVYRAASALLKNILKADLAVQALKLKAQGLQSSAGAQADLFQNRPALKRAIATVQEKCPGALYRVSRTEGAVFEENRYTYEPVTVEES